MNDLFWKIHSNNRREGPGSEKTTKLALDITRPFLKKDPKVLDIACGPGAASTVLAKELDTKILCMEPHQPFLDQLKEKAKNEGLEDKIITKNGKFEDLKDMKERFDLIWCEGAIYIPGVEKGLSHFKNVLSEDGIIAFSDAVFLKEEVASECEKFWTEAYPEITTINGIIKKINEAGLRLVGCFVEPHSDWENYFKDIQDNINRLRAQLKDNKEAQDYLDEEEYEINIFKKYKDEYSYCFFICRK